MKLEITKERILEAASKCSTAKQTLQVLFPEAFKQSYPLEVGDVYVHLNGKHLPILILRAHHNQDAYVCFGTTQDLCYSNGEFQNLLTKAQVQTYLERRELVFSHNILDAIHDLLVKKQ